MPNRGPSRNELAQAVHHVVYEYANLVSAGTLLTKHLDPPRNTHVQDAFLLSCRKVAKFLLSQKRLDDVVARDYAPGVKPKLPVWNQWKDTMDDQLAHITYTRVRAPRSWDGTANSLSLHEFHGAWRYFLARLGEPYGAKFQEAIDRRQTSEGFGGLDLT